VVDCAPTGATLRLLSFPDVARWWLDRVLGREAALLAAARPIARAFLDLTLPGEEAVAELQRLVGNLVAMDELLRDPGTSLRLVMTPDRVVVAEAMRTYTYLSLYGYLTDAVVVNRIFPAHVGAYFDAWRQRQEDELAAVQAGFAPVPVLRAPYFEREVAGPVMLDRLGAALFCERDPAALLRDSLAQTIELDGDEARLRVELPFAQRGDVALQKVGDELVLRVEGQKRTIVLPAPLAARRLTSASFGDGALVVRFAAAGADG